MIPFLLVMFLFQSIIGLYGMFVASDSKKDESGYVTLFCVISIMVLACGTTYWAMSPEYNESTQAACRCVE